MTRPPQLPEEVLEKFILGFEGKSLPDELRAYLAQGLGGVILFPRNFSSPENLWSLTQEIRRVAGRPVLIGVDQEGGTRFSLPEPFTQWVSPEELGRLGDTDLVERQAKAIARELAAVGCNLNFAPMLDLHLQPESPVTKGRSFGCDPAKVASFGAAFARGLDEGGVLACAKHFPGHGDTVIDPHLDLPVFQESRKRLRKAELVPFAAAIAAEVPFFMTAHISLPAVDADWPASLSREVLSGILREDMGCGGIVLADDLGMGALSRRWAPAVSAVRTFLAGSDMALICHDWNSVRPALAAVAMALDHAEFDSELWKESRTRIAKLKTHLKNAGEKMPPLSVVGCAEHGELVLETRAKLKSPAAAS
ncbi:MAG TPA: glycoside hydrolase family 3 protein [Candidatus Sulfotelmatobacter sp.]|nr:glycoside hydrolase family 3 protein [Candidatus Sulfotelmatobacter sp.]